MVQRSGLFSYIARGFEFWRRPRHVDEKNIAAQVFNLEDIDVLPTERYFTCSELRRDSKL
jgi:hypothetical protein